MNKTNHFKHLNQSIYFGATRAYKQIDMKQALNFYCIGENFLEWALFIQ